MAQTGMTASRLSIIAADHNRLFERLLEGYECRTDIAERASLWFDGNWPEEIPWPKTVRRQGWPETIRPEKEHHAEKTGT